MRKGYLRHLRPEGRASWSSATLLLIEESQMGCLFSWFSGKMLKRDIKFIVIYIYFPSIKKKELQQKAGTMSGGWATNDSPIGAGHIMSKVRVSICWLEWTYLFGIIFGRKIPQSSASTHKLIESNINEDKSPKKTPNPQPAPPPTRVIRWGKKGYVARWSYSCLPRWGKNANIRPFRSSEMRWLR